MQFLADMGPRPDGHSLERVNNNLGYGPENCIWATSSAQMVNRRNTRTVMYEGVETPLATLAKKYNVPANTLRARILKGWDLKIALTHPVREKMPNGFGRWRDA